MMKNERCKDVADLGMKACWLHTAFWDAPPLEHGHERCGKLVRTVLEVNAMLRFLDLGWFSMVLQ